MTCRTYELRKLGSFAFALLVSSLLLSTANAQVPIKFQQGVGGYEGTYDTTFQTGDPSNIWGDMTEWEWDGSDAGGLNFGVIRFEDIVGTGPTQVAPNTTVISAMLTLVVTNEGASDQIGTMHELLVGFQTSQIHS